MDNYLNAMHRPLKNGASFPPNLKVEYNIVNGLMEIKNVNSIIRTQINTFIILWN